MEELLQNCVVPWVMGGLGNQLFVMAAAYCVHKVNNLPLIILQTNPLKNAHNMHKYNYNSTIFSLLGKHVNLTQCIDKLLPQLFYTGYRDHVNAQQSGFLPWSPEAYHGKILMRNYYQYYPPLQQIEGEFTDLCLKGLEKHPNQPPEIDSATSAFLHIRRGDYLKYPHIHYIQPIEYYQKAVDTLKEKNPAVQTIYVLSDDMKWVNEQPIFRDPLFKLYESDDELQSFLFMTKCHAGAIIANSTFSWWGALMGSHKYNSPIMYPYRWISDPVHGLFPNSWIQISY
jgi:hypothetical protein